METANDDRNIDWVKVRRLAGLFKPYRLWLTLGVLFSILFGLTEPLLLQLLKPLIDHESEAGKGMPLSYFIPVAIILLAFLRGLLLFLSNYLLDRVSESMKRDLQSASLRHTLSLPLSYFDAEDSAVILRRVAHHVAVLKDAFTTVISPCVQGLAKMLGYVGLLLYTEWRLALAFLFIMPVLALVMNRYARRWRVLYRRLDEAEGGFSQYMVEIFRSARIVKAFGAENAESERYARHLKRIYGIGFRSHIAVNVARVGIQLLIASAFALAVAAGISFYNEGRLTIGALSVFVGSLLLMPIAIRRVTDIGPRFFVLMRSCDVVFELLDTGPERDVEQAKPMDRSKGGISFRNVSFSYPGKRLPAVSGISLEIAPGEKVALVGSSGSGKSTLLSLLLRFYFPSEGEVLIDGHDISQVSRDDVRKQFSWVTQEPHLFSGDIVSNIAYPDSEPVLAKVKEAVSFAEMDSFVSELPDGLKTDIGEGGVKLSGGQRQRLSIARAFYRNSPILLLDEISSALDSVTETSIYGSFQAISKGRTVIFISHRLSPVQDVDKIVLLDQGRVSAIGTHDELLVSSELYREFCSTQKVKE